MGFIADYYYTANPCQENPGWEGPTWNKCCATSSDHGATGRDSMKLAQASSNKYMYVLGGGGIVRLMKKICVHFGERGSL